MDPVVILIAKYASVIAHYSPRHIFTSKLLASVLPSKLKIHLERALHSLVNHLIIVSLECDPQHVGYYLLQDTAAVLDRNVDQIFAFHTRLLKATLYISTPESSSREMHECVALAIESESKDTALHCKELCKHYFKCKKSKYNEKVFCFAIESCIQCCKADEDVSAAYSFFCIARDCSGLFSWISIPISDAKSKLLYALTCIEGCTEYSLNEMISDILRELAVTKEKLVSS